MAKDLLEHLDNNSRRMFLKGAGKTAAGVIVVSALGCTSVSGAVGSKEAAKESKEPQAAGAIPWPYTTLDPAAVAERTYHEWFKNFCSMAVAEGIIGTLRDKVGGPYKTYPVNALRWQHGGGTGWGTLCGTLAGAGTSAALVAGPVDGDHIINDVIYWYSTTSLPIYKPLQVKVADPQSQAKPMDPVTSRANSPLCHVSVSTWMKKSGYEFFTPERKDRCARLAASVAFKTVELMNQWHEGTYVPVHSSQMQTHNRPAQNNCLSCHGS